MQDCTDSGHFWDVPEISGKTSIYPPVGQLCVCGKYVAIGKGKAMPANEMEISVPSGICRICVKPLDSTSHNYIDGDWKCDEEWHWPARVKHGAI